MEQHEAERALSIIRSVIASTREDLVAHNWGIIYIAHSFTNLAAVSAGVVIDRAALPVFWYLAPLAGVAAVNLVIVLLLAERDRGIRSAVQWQLHGIWVPFIVFSALFTVAIHATDAPPRLFCPVFAMTSGFGFAMMGVFFNRRFFAYAALFLAAMLAAPFAGNFEWCLVGVVWWSAMFFPGLAMHREKRRRQQDEHRAEIL